MERNLYLQLGTSSIYEQAIIRLLTAVLCLGMGMIITFNGHHWNWSHLCAGATNQEEDPQAGYVILALKPHVGEHRFVRLAVSSNMHSEELETRIRKMYWRLVGNAWWTTGNLTTYGGYTVVEVSIAIFRVYFSHICKANAHLSALQFMSLPGNTFTTRPMPINSRKEFPPGTLRPHHLDLSWNNGESLTALLVQQRDSPTKLFLLILVLGSELAGLICLGSQTGNRVPELEKVLILLISSLTQHAVDQISPARMRSHPWSKSWQFIQGLAICVYLLDSGLPRIEEFLFDMALGVVLRLFYQMAYASSHIFGSGAHSLLQTLLFVLVLSDLIQPVGYGKVKWQNNSLCVALSPMC